jgi:hypothetical protein
MIVPRMPEQKRHLQYQQVRELEKRPIFLNLKEIPRIPKREREKKKSVAALSNESMDEGVKALLSHSIRDAIYDIWPQPDKQRVRPYMYWNPNKTLACVKMLLRRSPSLQVLAEKYPKNAFFARMYAEFVRTSSNNERSMQKRQAKLIFTSPDSDFAMVKENVSGSGGNGQDITVSNALSSEFNTIQDLRNAIASPTMYTHPALFDLFCAGLESGRLRSTKKMKTSPIEQLITVAHEARFRLELWYSLRGLNYSHDTSKTNIQERHEKFAEFCRHVNEDRHDNATAAFTSRTTEGPPIADDAGSSSDSDDGCEQDYW